MQTINLSSVFAALKPGRQVMQTSTIQSLSCMAFVVAVVTCTSGHGDVRMEKVGDPLWEIAEPTMRVQPGASSGQDINRFRRNIRERQSEILGEGHVLAKNPLRHQTLPGEAHQGPYGREWRESLAAAGEINTDAFFWNDAKVPHGILLGYTLVPSAGAPMGASSDFSHGPIIPNDILPIRQERYHRTRNGHLETVKDLNVPVDLESLDRVGEVTDENGAVRDYTGLNWSHAHRETAFIWTSGKSKSRIVGEWEYTVEMRDANGDGWDITYAYDAVPERTDLLGDFSYNDELDLRDLNILTQNVAVGATNLKLDLNGDETVNVADIHHWVTDLKSTWIGDANLDGEFNSGDLVAVFQAGKYETDQITRWSEGDWNGDERFDSGDFVVAFKAGGYEIGPPSSLATVPEPSGMILLLLGLIGVHRCRRNG